ncbi:VCBS repeat-containing protein [Flavobacterium sp. LPB0248]|uniref:RHS repeat-associated core domain-containing protein n=1 Tax=Flavobacterium sp. LPB0248 TaxID=2614441 RepID=UPI0015A6D90D|nr:RHS repeat-associated core domain-containing protein [Flavobacterium sp. LPB0248]QLC67022.1 VCBS repeat-containing protein [Flavobacterium sp. LPB0248]
MRKFYISLLFLLVGLLGFGQSAEVGVTEGELSVSLTGAANYKIPIAVPPGINGVAPQISLSYNSQGGIGMAGFGWNILGISAITRIPSTLYHDGIIDPVDFNGLDRLALDDKRLVLKSSEKFDVGGTKRIYETEIFSNLKITGYSGYVQNNNTLDLVFSPVDYFTVEYPDGSMAKYENHGSATDWTISYWENPQGVVIKYEYNTEYSGSTSSTNNSVIEKITYGALKSGSQINEIQFVYKSNYRMEQVYIGGKNFVRNKILSGINMKTNGTGFRSYSLTHDTSSLGYSRLTSITEKSGDGSKSYNPTVFKYAENQTLLSPQIEYFGDSNGFYMSSSLSNVVVGDFDGDGDIEFVNHKDYKGGFSLNKVLDDNSVKNLSQVDNVFPSNRALYAVNTLDSNLKISRKESVCAYVQESALSSQYYYKIYTYNLDTKNLELDYQKAQPLGAPYLGVPSLAADFDGDGMTELIRLKEPVNGYSQIQLINLDRRKSADFITEAGSIQIGPSIDTSGGKGTSFAGLSSVKYGDVNGDGKMDIVVFRGDPYNDITVYTLKDNVFVQLFRVKQNMPGDIGDLKWSRIEVFPIVMGDFNGDGKCDIFLADLKKILLATGGDYFVEEYLLSYVPRKYDQNYVPEVLVAFDYNNDGKADILSIKLSETGSPSFQSRIDVNLFYRTNQWFNYSFNNTRYKPTLTKNFIPLFTRKNKTNEFKTDLAIIQDGNISFFSNKNYVEGQNLLKTITLGNGVKETLTYMSLNDNNGIYTAGTSQVYPNMDMKFNSGFKVVSLLEKQSSNQYKKQLYQYGGAVMNLEGLGFLGFGSTVKTNWHDNTSQIISYISKNDISLRGANVENYTVLGLHEPLYESSNQVTSSIIKENNYTVTGTENLVASQSITLKPNTWIKPGSSFLAKINTTANKSINEPSTFVTKSILTYESELFSNKVFKVKNVSAKQFNGFENTTSETRINYDNYNNPTKITATNEGASTKQTSITDIVYQNIESPVYIVGRPLSKIQNVTLGSEKMRTEESYDYNAQQLLFQVQKKGDETTNYITENREYDKFGNITKRTLKAGQDTREFNFEYDTSGRFLSKETDAEKLVTSYLFNANGTLKSITNPLGQTTGFEYDSWFRKKYETNYLGNINEYKYVNSIGYTIVTKTYTDGNVTEETFDDLGRKIKSGSKNIMGSFTYVSYAYDVQDRNYKVSEPYIGTTPSQWNETKYDDYGRVETQTAYTGKATNFLYTGLTTTVNDGTISKTYRKDAVGNVISMFDVPSNEIKYTYFANGELKEVNYDGIKTKFLQDGWGRKKQIDDPSAGIFKYTYNDFGELISEENKNGVTSYKLTPEGRLDEKTISGLYTNFKTKYTYDGTNKLLINSQFNDGVNTIKTDYIYDDKKRIGTKIESTPFAVFTKDYRYDSYGRLLTEASIASRLGGKASSKTVKYGYKNGALYQIFDNGTNALLWQTNTINAKGQLLTAQNGPLTLTNEYDSYGYNKQFKFDKTTPSVNILSLGTSFNAATGNLDNRTNNIMAWNESFNYDNFDRLTEFTGISGAKETQAYDNKGRITQNSLGTYTYSNEKPYQNASITVSPEALQYYTAKPSQIIDYNVFKSPILINEKDVDKVSFDYNDNNYRTAMFYGDLQDDKLKRPFRKYYSADGTMEIKENRTAGVIDFVTYIGGDGYTAPIVFKSNGDTDQKYLFLQRDYQNSIVAVTDQSGTVLEKRVFDAWGAIAKVQDGAGNTLSGLTILDRGYTGHEHLQSVGLINMNARLYDPKLHRFLQPDNNIQDPFNTQNYNRYGYVMNNPLRYTDPSGEFWNVVFGYLFAAYVKGAYESGGQLNPGKWNSNAWTSAFAGAASGAASSYTTGVVNNYLDNYNNKPALGSSAIGSGYDLPSFVENNSKGDFDFREASNIGDTRPLIQQYNDNPREPYAEYDPAGAFFTFLATDLALGEHVMFNKDTWYSLKTMKSYGQHFNGNGATGGKVASALKMSNKLKWGGRGISAYNAWSIYDSYSNNEIDELTFVTEQSSNAYATFGGSYGVAWGIGWEAGRWITTWNSYQKWKQETVLPWRREKFGY